MDINYIETWSLRKDIQLIIKSIKTIFYGKGH
jgi:lipopolysaccharide/colanic/teichoic acid biosynthesis glycosyltransferase